MKFKLSCDGQLYAREEKPSRHVQVHTASSSGPQPAARLGGANGAQFPRSSLESHPPWGPLHQLPSLPFPMSIGPCPQPSSQILGHLHAAWGAPALRKVPTPEKGGTEPRPPPEQSLLRARPPSAVPAVRCLWPVLNSHVTPGLRKLWVASQQNGGF